jgi:hypothetical protein
MLQALETDHLSARCTYVCETLVCEVIGVGLAQQQQQRTVVLLLRLDVALPLLRDANC